jgi:hypothetical protein
MRIAILQLWLSLQEADLRGTKSMAEIVSVCISRIKPNFCGVMAGIKTIGK